MIHIFLISTGCYCKILDKDRLSKYNYLFPDKEKTFNYISDSDEKYDLLVNTLDDTYKNINYNHICNLIYPFIPLLKFNFVEDAINKYKYSDDDFFMYFDAHSMIIEKSNTYWDNMYNNLVKYDICYSTNPYNYDHWLMSTEVDERSKHHVTFDEFKEEPDRWGQTSFLSGKIGSLKRVNEIINQFLLDDLRYSNHDRVKNGIIPNFIDQHYFNYLFYHNDEYGITTHHEKYMKLPCESITDDDIDNSYMMRCHFSCADSINEKRNSTKYKKDL